MNQIIKQKWLDALRSGQYKQTRGNLCNKHGFCCLGVLCDLYAKETQTEWGNESSDFRGAKDFLGDFRGAKDFLGEYATLPVEVMEWVELKETNPLVKSGDGLTSLVMLNDQGLSFNEIAEVIEEQL